ncbi:MAG: thioredoxin family protein [Elusimicrobia bacterium]|nr:thioredoxin family protein [Elusimicrobiota bacterium]
MNGFLPILLLLALASPLLADDVHTKVSLAPETTAVRSGDPVWVALRFQIDPGWHIYWVNSGDSGLPPRVKWTLPAGFKAGPWLWPNPEKIETPPLINFGYKDEAILLARLDPPANLSGGQVTFEADVDWLECSDICLTQKAHLALKRPVSNDPPIPETQWAPLFARARAQLPVSESEWRVQAFSGQNKIRLLLQPPPGKFTIPSDVLFFPSDPALGTAPDQSVSPSEEGLTLEFTPAKTVPVGGRLDGVLVSQRGWRGPASEKGLAVESILLAWDKAPAPAVAPESRITPILLAFLGGILLNLMPCVLPVLSIKILSFLQHAPEERRTAFRQAVLYAVGILVTFWALAFLLIVLRNAGREIGWGFQLQSPGFVAFLSGLFFVMGLSFAGVFEIGTSLTVLGRFNRRAAGTSAFFSGVLATVVATPCTAPFMGAALGYALVQPSAVALLIFTALGMGMAAPYSLLVLWPGLARWVPRPGPWMDALKQGMGFLLLGTTVWLLWVLGRQAGAEVMTGVLGAFWLIALGAWVLRRWATPARSNETRNLARVIGLLLILGGGAAGILMSSRPTAGSPSGLAWESYSPERLSELRRSGHPVFVDFTAAWCITCQVNERTALQDRNVVDRFQSLGVVPLKADWTTYDPVITRALRDHGRSGVPLYVFYGRDGEPGKVLPALLTPGAVMRALKGENHE